RSQSAVQPYFSGANLFDRPAELVGCLVLLDDAHDSELDRAVEDQRIVRASEHDDSCFIGGGGEDLPQQVEVYLLAVAALDVKEHDVRALDLDHLKGIGGAAHLADNLEAVPARDQGP